MSQLDEVTAKYDVPDDITSFLNDGFLEVLSEDESEKTIKFHIPSKRVTDIQGRITTYTLTWIHPQYNDQFCHYYVDKPGDLPNFFVTKDTTDSADEQIDGLDGIADLVEWLGSLQNADFA